MEFTQIPANTMETLQLNAGILVDSFVPSTGVIGNLIGATSGGINFTDTPTYSDWGDDIDNCPKNMKELKHIDDREVKLSGTFLTITSTTAKKLIGGADIDGIDTTKIVPRNTLASTDFTDLWWVGDYSDKNTGTATAGYVAIHMLNVLNTSGFQIQTTDKAKGQFAFEFTGHYSMADASKVPYELYIKQGTAQVVPSILINKHILDLETGASETLTATVVPSGQSVSWSSASSSVASITSGGVVTAGGSAGNTIITASITVDGVTYSDTCTVVVTEAG